MNEFHDETFENDILPPDFVHEQIDAHDQMMSKNAHVWALAKSMYMTRYWNHVRSLNAGEIADDFTQKIEDTDVEVNRMWPFISSYISALYPRANRVVVGADPSGAGNPQLAEAVANQWLASNRVHRRIVNALRQAVLYPGVGVKMGHESGSGSALSRVWMRVIPWWEMILDHDAKDPEDERFRGHIYYRPKKEVEIEYGLSDLKGCSRQDFLETEGNNDHKTAGGNDEIADSDKDAFVRVVEFCNLVDSVGVGDDSFRGRLEVYVLDQGDAKFKEPIHIGPLPFSDHDRVGVSHILPLVFNSEPEYPLRGIAHSERVIPQFRELNHYRSFYAQASRKDTRQYVTKSGYFDADQLADLTSGSDGLILEVKQQDYDGPLDQAIVPLKNAPLSSNIHHWTDFVERDIEMAIGISPNVRGSITKATAEEVRNTQYYTESEFGLHAMLKDQWLADLVQLMIRVLISAMQTVEDSTGGFKDEGQAVVGPSLDEEPTEGEADSGFASSDKEEEAEDTEDTEDEDSKEVPVEPEDKDEADEEYDDAAGKLDQIEAALTGKPAPERAKQSLTELGAEDEDGSLKIVSESIYVKLSDEIYAVTVEDLDAAFAIEFVEGGRTPLADQQNRAHLVELMEPYFSLWEAANGNDHNAILAEAYMKAMAEAFDLPRDLHFDQLKSSMKIAVESGKIKTKKQAQQEQQAAQQQASQQQQQQQAQQPPQQQSQAPITPEQIMQLPIPQLEQIIMDTAEDPQRAQAFIKEASELPPEDRQKFLAGTVIDAMSKQQQVQQ